MTEGREERDYLFTVDLEAKKIQKLKIQETAKIRLRFTGP
jgi:hypothetical protein